MKHFLPYKRYLISKAIDIKRKYSLLKVCYMPASSVTSSKAFYAVTINSTNDTNKAGSTRHK